MPTHRSLGARSRGPLGWALYAAEMSDSSVNDPFSWPTNIERTNPDDWPDFKLRCADWYINALTALEQKYGELDRLVGVEMALDGALSSLVGAFDSAVRKAHEAARRVGLATVPARTHKWNEETLAKIIAEAQARGLVSPGNDLCGIEAALGPDTSPGWLTDLKRARNRSMHMTSLQRNHYVWATTTSLEDAAQAPQLDEAIRPDPPGSLPETEPPDIIINGTPRQPLEYLEEVRIKIAALVAQIHQRVTKRLMPGF